MKVAKVSEVKDGEKKEVEVEGKAILLINSCGNFFAVEAHCPHKNLPLIKGRVEGSLITCAYHGSKFDFTNGKVINGPATRSLTTYKAKVEGEDIDVEV
jgi:nitrite reductase/ring-hydroxylating ferredoxin subunit